MSIIYTIIILGVLIFVHELGHFVVAKKSGVRVDEFALGMGPKLWGKTKGGTLYSLRVFPIGGYVKMLGENGESNEADSFTSQSAGKRAAILAAGPLMNILIAVVLFMIAFMYIGVPSDSPVIGSLEENSPAVAAGLLAGDEVTAIQGVAVNNWTDMVDVIRNHPDEKITFSLVRDGKTLEIPVMTHFSEEQGYAVVGIKQSTDRAEILPSIKMGFVQTYEFTRTLFVALGQMIAGEAPVDVAGPVGIVGIVGNVVASSGIMYLFLLAGILSINLGIMNLLPFPALDGSRLLFILVEAIRRRPINPDKEAMVHFVGLIALFALMILITYNDILRLIGVK